MTYAHLNEPAHVLVHQNSDTLATYGELRSGVITKAQALARMDEIEAAAKVRLDQLGELPSMRDATTGVTIPRVPLRYLSDLHLAAAVLDGPLRGRVPAAIRRRVAASPATGGEAMALLRAYLDI